MTSEQESRQNALRLLAYMRSNGAIETETEALREIQNLMGGAAFGLIVASAIGRIVVDRAGISLVLAPYDLVQLLVVIFVLVLAVLWIASGRRELSTLQESLRGNHYKLESHTSIYLSFLGLAIFFALLAASIPNIHWFLTIFAVYLILDLGLWRLRWRVIGKAIDDTRGFLQRQIERIAQREAAARSRRHRGTAKALGQASVLPRGDEAALIGLNLDLADIIEAYYLRKPHMRRITINLATTSVLAAAAWSAHVAIANGARPFRLNGIPLGFNLCRTAAYIAFIAAFAISEFRLAGWRRAMHDAVSERTRRIRLIEERDELGG